MARLQRAAEQEVTNARAALDAMPKVGSGSPLADRLGVTGWEIDLTAAALASIAANGLAAVLIAFAAHGHGHSQQPKQPAKVIPRSVTPAAPPVAERDPAMGVAARFARVTFKPDEEGRIPLQEIRAAYHAWCASEQCAPLPDHEIGRALNSLFSRVGLYREGHGSDAVIVGINWKGEAIERRLIPAPKLVDVEPQPRMRAYATG